MTLKVDASEALYGFRYKLRSFLFGFRLKKLFSMLTSTSSASKRGTSWVTWKVWHFKVEVR